MKTTITEALAELKTIKARVGKKREFIRGILGRQEAFKDPHEKSGGSAKLIREEFQAIAALNERVIAIRSAIQAANRTEMIAIGGRALSIQDWLVWRRDVAPDDQAFLRQVQSNIATIRSQAAQKGAAINAGDTAKPSDVVINVDERDLATLIENLEQWLGELDGKLSLKNATVTIELP